MGIISIGNVYMSIIVNGGYLEARCYDSGSQLTNTDAHKITPNQWCHVAGVFSGGNVTLYKDGVATAAVACSNEAIAASAGYFQIGKGYVSGYLWMDGEIASPMAFDTALSASQIKEIYQDSKVIIPSNVSQTNLRGWWTFADGAGTICYDGSGRGIHGEFQNMESADWSTGQTGCPQLVEGYNRPVKFASGDYINVPQDSSLDIGTNDFTACGWWYGDPSQTQGPQLFMQFAGAGGWRIVATGAPAYRFSVFDNGWTNYASGDVGVTLGQWNHIAVSADRSGTAVLYLNGAASGSPLTISGVTGTLTNAYPLRIGSGTYTSTTPPTDFTYGGLNECIIYNGIALNSTDIAALAATDANGGPLPPDPTTMTYSTTSYSSSYLKGYWRNDGNVTWTDRSGNSNTGTVTGGNKDTLLFKQGINGSASTSTGRDGQGFPLLYKNVGAVGFNGSDAYIDVGQGFNHTAAMTCEVWALIKAGSGAGGQVLFGQWFNLSAKRKWYIGTDATNLYFYIDSAGSGTFTSVNAGAYPTDGKFHSYAFVYIPSVSLTAYIDGVVVGTDTSSVASSIYSATDVNIYMGRDEAGSYFDGQIGSSKIYTRALSQAEIKQNFNAQANRFQVPRSIVTEGLVLNLDAGNPGSYPGSGTAWYDVSGNDCDFTLDGSGITYSASNGGIFTLANGGAEQTAGAQIASSTNSTVVIWMYTTDGQSLFWDRADISGSYFVGAYRSGNKEYYGTCGTPDFYMDTVAKSNIYDYFPDGNWHMVEFKNVDLSSWSSDVGFNRYGGYQFGNGAVGKIMIYNRTISAAESAQNFRVDRERFGI
jgi:hypothetical protein